jgi:hypothetical protein
MSKQLKQAKRKTRQLKMELACNRVQIIDGLELAANKLERKIFTPQQQVGLANLLRSLKPLIRA